MKKSGADDSKHSSKNNKRKATPPTSPAVQTQHKDAHHLPSPVHHESKGAGSGRLMELLKLVRTECEALAFDSSALRSERDDLKKRLELQVAEAEAMKEALAALKKKHDSLKGRYEEEFQRFKSQAAASSTGRPTTGLFAPEPAPSFSYPAGTAPAVAAPAADGPDAKKQKTEAKEGNILSPLQKSDDKATAPPANPAPAGPPAVPKAAKAAPVSSGIESGTVVKKEGYILVYNQQVGGHFNVDLKHTVSHESVVCCVRFSNDGRYLATGCNKSAQIYDAVSGAKVVTFKVDNVPEKEDSYVRSVCFSPDGTYLAAGAEDRTVKVWDVQSQTLHHTLSGHDLDIYSLDYSSDGRHIISGSGDRKVRLWDATTATCRHVLAAPAVPDMDGGVTSISFSPDSTLVAAGSLDRVVRVWNTETGQLVDQFEGHEDSVYSVSFSPDGQSLVSGSLDRTLRLWDINRTSKRKATGVFVGHKDFVLSVAFSPGGQWIVSGSKDRSVQFWDPRTAATRLLLQGHSNSVISVACSPTGNLLGTGSGDSTARVWGYDSGPVAALNK